MDRKIAHRKMIWETIQRDNPKHAEFITEFNKIFGKPKQLIYESDGIKLDSMRETP